MLNHVAEAILPVSKKALWAGRIVSAVVVLFLLFDGVTKLMKIEPVLKASAQLGLSVNKIAFIGSILLAATAVYIYPQTSVLGAILLTGYLGGAVAIQCRIGNPLFETVLPVIFGVLLWGGLFLRDRKLRTLIPVRR